MFKLEFETSNAAFVDLEIEVKDLLDSVALEVERGKRSGNVRDTNGNTVGAWELTDD